jgi:hypothetical protein
LVEKGQNIERKSVWKVDGWVDGVTCKQDLFERNERKEKRGKEKGKKERSCRWEFKAFWEALL